MADKKAKEEVTQSPKQKVDTSNRVEDEGANPASPSVKIEGDGNIVIQESNQAKKLKQSEVTEISDQEEKQPEEEHKPKLHVLAADRLNSLINEANELGITDIVQILNADRTGQFYLVYRE